MWASTRAGHSAAQMLERHAIDDIVRAIDARLRVFDAGRVLMTREGS